MMKFIILILISACLIDAVSVNPLPIPKNVTWGSEQAIRIDENAKLNNPENEIINKAFERTFETIRTLKWAPEATESGQLPQGGIAEASNNRSSNVTTINQVSVIVNDYDEPLQLGVNESYSLKIENLLPVIEIESETIWGALHALRTLQQLIIFNEQGESFYVEGSVDIWDVPMYQHRGLMIDSSRNFLTVKSILEQIDIMSLSKMNTLHWHLDDAQSWLFEMLSYPEMTKDAYSKREIYTQNEVRNIVHYAYERGVRVVPELDVPGHARAGWKQIDKELVVCGDESYTKNANEPPPGQLDIIYNNTYSVVKKVYNELSSLFRDDLFHVGGDELKADCYNSSKNIQNWYLNNPSLTINDLVQYWLDRALPIFNNRKERRLMMWEDVITSSNSGKSLPKDVIMQCWDQGTDCVKKLTSMGHDVVVSSATHLYLDCGYGGFQTNDPRYMDSEENEEFNSGTGGSWCNPYKTWQRIYSYDFTANLTLVEKQHIIGAEVALWSEQVDSTVLTQKIWPRSAALAELTWSGNKDDDGELRTDSLTQRIFNFREYLVALGYSASPLVPKYCIKNPHACDMFPDTD